MVVLTDVRACLSCHAILARRPGQPCVLSILCNNCKALKTLKAQRCKCICCGNEFIPRNGMQKTCGLECARQNRLHISREIAKAKYVRVERPSEVACIICDATFTAFRFGRIPKICPDCEREKQNIRPERYRPDIRPCHKCGTEVSGQRGRPGVTVCENCRCEKRDPERARLKERRRTLRKYGLTPEQFDAMFARQGHRCPGCERTEPTAKGWVVDHCHSTGRNRMICCHPCNLIIGMAREDSAVLRKLADIVEIFNVVKVVM